jgi:hypothetical protein
MHGVLTQQQIDGAVHVERLNTAASAVERMIEGFSKCLESINKYDADTRVALATGGKAMEKLQGDVDSLGTAQRDHATGPEGMHKHEGKLIWWAISLIAAGTGYTAGFLLYTHTLEFLLWWSKILGVG